jgi:hypothetical protein
MSVIERWTVTACQNCGGPFDSHSDCPNDRDNIHIEGGSIEVVLADQLAGAVERCGAFEDAVRDAMDLMDAASPYYRALNAALRALRDGGQ